MSQLLISPSVTDLIDLPAADIAAGKVLTDLSIQAINQNVKFASMRLESFFLGFFAHGATVNLDGMGNPVLISPVDGYTYGVADTIIYDWDLYTNRAPGSGFVNGQLTPPPISSSQAGNQFWWTAAINASAVTVIRVNYDGAATFTNNGILKVYAHCQRQSGMALSAGYTFVDVPEGRLCLGQPLRESDILALSENAKYGAERKEVFDAGYWAAGYAVATPVSPVDGYTYSRDECRYKVIFYSNLAPDIGPPVFTNGQLTAPTIANGQLARRSTSATSGGPLFFWATDLDDSTGIITTTIEYNVQDGSLSPWPNDGIFRVLIFAQRDSTQAGGASSGSGGSSPSGGGGVSGIGGTSGIGSQLNVNAVVATNPPNLNDTLPAASANKRNVKWQLSGVSISAQVDQPLTTKGDILTYAADVARLAVGANTKVLKADSTASTGNKWDFVAESEVTFTNITTGDTSAAKHGYMPAVPNDATKFATGADPVTFVHVDLSTAAVTGLLPVASITPQVAIVGAGLPHTVPIPKITPGGANGSITFNADGSASWVDPT